MLWQLYSWAANFAMQHAHISSCRCYLRSAATARLHGRVDMQTQLECIAGTFGRVLECWDRKNRDYVAIKIIRSLQKYRDAAMIEVQEPLLPAT